MTTNTGLKRRFQSPPKLNSSESFTFSPSSPSFGKARTRGSNKAKTAAVVTAGVGLAVGVAALFSGEPVTPVAPAGDSGAYTLENPELVVMDDSLDRIDLSRETDCSSTGDGCTETNRIYHRVGLHVGHGVVQDLNGNLFVAPQLAAEGIPGKVAVNPTSLDLKATRNQEEGRLRETSPGHYEVSGGMFGSRQEIDFNGDEVTVVQRGLFGNYESIRIENHDGIISITDAAFGKQFIQPQGDHILVQGSRGQKYGEIRHNPEAGEYSLRKPYPLGHWEYNVSYSTQHYTRSSNTDESTVAAVSNGEGSIRSELGWNRGGYDSNDTSTGWTTRPEGLLSRTYTYTVDGGQ